MKSRREVFQQVRQGVMDGLGGDDMVVIEDESNILCKRAQQVIRKEGHHRFR